MPGPSEERALSLAEGLNSVAIHLVRRLRRADVALGVGPSRLSALAVLVFGGPQSLGELASAEQVTPATMSRVVSGLEADGLAVRRLNLKDRRALRITATPRGRRLMYRGRRLRVERLADRLQDLTLGDLGQLERGVEILRRLERAPD
jgi:DNA-binding MarR family transcriptional regulator